MKQEHPVISVLTKLWSLNEETKLAFEEIIQFKRFNKCLATRHNFIEVVSMGNQQFVFDGVICLKIYLL